MLQLADEAVESPQRGVRPRQLRLLGHRILRPLLLERVTVDDPR